MRHRRGFSRQMYNLVIYLCEGRASAIVRGAPDHNGLEAWRLLHEWYQPKTRSRSLALLNETLGWDFGTKEQFLQRMKDWENATLEYNRTLQEEVQVFFWDESRSGIRVDFPFSLLSVELDWPASTPVGCTLGGGSRSCPVRSSTLRGRCSRTCKRCDLHCPDTQASHPSRLTVAAPGCGATLCLAASS